MTGSTHGEVGCGRVSDGSIRRLNSYRSKIAHWCRFVDCQLPLLLRIHHLFAFSSFHFLQEKKLDLNTLFEIFIFCPKIQLWFPDKIVDFFGVKNSWKCCGFELFSCWQLWLHEKICQKKIGWKTRANVGVLSKLNFWTKIWHFE